MDQGCLQDQGLAALHGRYSDGWAVALWRAVHHCWRVDDADVGVDVSVDSTLLLRLLLLSSSSSLLSSLLVLVDAIDADDMMVMLLQVLLWLWSLLPLKKTLEWQWHFWCRCLCTQKAMADHD